MGAVTLELQETVDDAINGSPPSTTDPSKSS